MKSHSKLPEASPKSKKAGRPIQPTARQTHPHAAGIDIGARKIMVCVPAEAAPHPVRTFGTFTDELEALAQWLRSCRVDTVAMESTGNYWIPLHQVLSRHGIEVMLVNARHVRHVPGRKSDIIDCQWLQYLHAIGHLRGSFRPAPEICAIRSLVRYREQLLAQAGDQIRQMHNAFDQMNVQLHHVLSDLSGTTGQAIVRALVAGERDPERLAQHRDRRVRATPETLVRALRGDWRREHLLVLELALATWDQLRAQIVRLDGEIAQLVGQLQTQATADLPPPSAGQRRRSVSANTPAGDLRAEHYRILGTDLTAVPAISSLTVQTFLSEVGPDLSRFPQVECFTKWLQLCPGTKITGGKVLDARTGRGKGRLARALRQAALSLHHEQGVLGARYRRLRARLGAPKALTAMGHLLARILYVLVTRRCAYDESVFARQEEHHQRRQQERLEKQAQALGFTLRPLAASEGN